MSVSRKRGAFVWLLAMTAACLLFATAFANGARAQEGTTINVAPDGEDVEGCGVGEVGPCATIQFAIGEVEDGATVSVAAGTYEESAINVDKALTIQGAGPESIIDGGDEEGTGQSGNVRLAATDDITFTGFTIQNPSARNALNSEHIGMFAQGPEAAEGSTYTISNVQFVGEGVGGQDRGFYADRNFADLEISEIEITNTDFTGLGIEEQRGASTVENSVLEAGVFEGDPAQIAYFNWSLSGPNDDFDVTETQTFQNNTVTGSGVRFFTGIAGNTTRNGGFADGTIVVSGNTFEDIPSGGIGVQLSNRNNTEGTGDLPAIEGASITGNSITGAEDTADQIAVDIESVSEGPITGTNVNFNRLFVSATGVASDVAGDVDATNNWWGCNEGPDTEECNLVEDDGEGAVDSDPWLVMDVEADSDSVRTNGNTSDVTASFDQNSAEADVDPLFPDGVEVAFDTDLGAVDPATDLTEDALAQTTLTSGSVPGTASVEAQLDNQTVSDEVQIESPENVPNRCTIVGTPQDDVLIGTSGRDVICGLGGNDVLRGLGGNDILLGGPGNDRLVGGPGNDVLQGEAGNDFMVAGTGVDRLLGGAGSDRLNVRDGRGQDLANGGGGNDFCASDRGDRVVNCERP